MAAVSLEVLGVEYGVHVCDGDSFSADDIPGDQVQVMDTHPRRNVVVIFLSIKESQLDTFEHSYA